VDNSVREAPRITPPNVLARMTSAMKQRIYSEFIQYGQDFFDESIPKTFATTVVPRRNLDDIILRFRPCDNLPVHGFVRDWRCSRIVSSGKEDAGFKRWAARRESTKASSDSDSAGSSNSMTRRIRS